MQPNLDLVYPDSVNGLTRGSLHFQNADEPLLKTMEYDDRS